MHLLSPKRALSKSPKRRVYLLFTLLSLALICSYRVSQFLSARARTARLTATTTSTIFRRHLRDLNLRKTASTEHVPNLAFFRTPNGLNKGVSEFFAIHSNLCLSPSDAYTLAPRPPHTCFSWHGDSRAPTECEHLVEALSREAGNASRGFQTAYAPRVATSAHSLYDETLLVVTLNPRDANVCHTAMRLMLAWAYTRRAASGAASGRLPRPTAVAIFTGPSLKKLFNYPSCGFGCSQGYSFGAGLVRALFEAVGTPLVVAADLDELMTGESACFRQVVHTGSFSNRFMFPDREFPNGNLGPGSEVENLDWVSADAKAVRKLAFAPYDPPAMRNKLVYIARTSRPGQRRYFVEGSEKRVRYMLGRLALKFSSELLVVEGEESRNQSFGVQVNAVGDASVVFGLHGAGLSHSIFAPPRTAELVEIMPSNMNLNLFGTIRNAAGGTHTLYKLKAQPIDKNCHVVDDMDLLAMQQLLDDALRRGIQSLDNT